MIDHDRYNASTVDMDHLRQYARIVAQETRLPQASPITIEESETVYDRHTERAFFGFGRPREIVTARKVNKEVEVVGPHWLLDRSDWHKRETFISTHSRVEEEEHSYTYLVLLPTGEMQLAITSKLTLIQREGPGESGLMHDEEKGSIYPVREHHVTELDFEREYTEGSWSEKGVEGSSWGYRTPGKQLIHPYKGGGLSSALKAIHEGRRLF